jgi:hypothetical protein
MKKDKLLVAAIAGIALGATAPGVVRAQDAKDEVKCYGINGCGAHAKCSVAADDLAAIKGLLGPKEYKARFGKSEAHSCGAHAKCGTPANILNWVPTSADQCKAEGGFVINTENGKKVAKKA